MYTSSGSKIENLLREYVVNHRPKVISCFCISVYVILIAKQVEYNQISLDRETMYCNVKGFESQIPSLTLSI